MIDDPRNVRPDVIRLTQGDANSPLAMDCEAKDIAAWIRLYFKPNATTGYGFDAVVVEIIATSTADPWG